MPYTYSRQRSGGLYKPVWMIGGVCASVQLSGTMAVKLLPRHGCTCHPVTLLLETSMVKVLELMLVLWCSLYGALHGDACMSSEIIYDLILYTHK